MVADIEMADRPHDDPDYMEDVIQNMIDDGSQYFIDYHEIMQGNPTEQQEGTISIIVTLLKCILILVFLVLVAIVFVVAKLS